MSRAKKQSESDEAAGAPEWMVTFSDCMTLLLTFFVLLLSFSSFDDKVFLKLTKIFAKGLPSVSREKSRDKEAFLHMPLIRYEQEFEEGSEKPTLKKGTEDNVMEETEPSDFHKRKVFLIASDRVFWGKGTVISLKGRKTLSALASFLNQVQERIVISENGRVKERDEEDIGLRRAWAVLYYLTEKNGLDKRRFSISAVSTLAQDDVQSEEFGYNSEKTERMLEIVLLERSIYN